MYIEGYESSVKIPKDFKLSSDLQQLVQQSYSMSTSNKIDVNISVFNMNDKNVKTLMKRKD